MKRKSARRTAHDILIIIEKATSIDMEMIDNVECAVLPMPKEWNGKLTEFDHFCKSVKEDFEFNFTDEGETTSLYYKKFDKDKGLMYFSFTPLRDAKISIPEQTSN